MNYWSNREECAKHATVWNALMHNKYSDKIKDSIECTTIYKVTDYPQDFKREGDLNYNIRVIQETTTDAILRESKDSNSGKIAALNFASYKNPGGMFLKGSSAQEESLCHVSTLYPVLKAFESSYYAVNRNNINRALYTDKLLYSEDIQFFENDTPVCNADIITCAAPNWGTFQKYNETTEYSINLNGSILSTRFCKLFLAAEEHNVDTLVLGAWGCGVFKQDPYKVADLMIHNILTISTGIKNIVFAVPDKVTYDIFYKVIISCLENKQDLN